MLKILMCSIIDLAKNKNDMKLKCVNNLSNSSFRTMNILKHIGASSLYKGISIILSLLLVPLSISYLGVENYGLWLTIFSFIGWFRFFNFGIGNGLRNKLTQALSSNNIELAQMYVSTAYITMAIIIAILILVYLVIHPLIPWEIVFNAPSDAVLVNKLIAVVFIIFAINLLLNLITAMFYADQKSSLPNLIHLIGQITIVITIYITIAINHASLFIYGSIVMGSQLLVLLLSNLVVFKFQYKNLKPKLSFFKIEFCYDIFSLGAKFFLIQIAVIIIYSTDNYIINYFLGSAEVTIYNIALKYFMLTTIGMTIIVEPFWSAFTEAKEKNDVLWIKKSMTNLLKLSGLASLLVLIMILVSEHVYIFWIGKAIRIPYSLTILMGVNTIIQLFLQPFIMYINGVGKIKIQMLVGLTSAVINVPLSILLAVNLDFGISGVILATIITRITGMVIYPIQAYKLINNTARKIWNT